MTTHEESRENMKQTTELIIERSGGLEECLKHFGWGGGTIHQVKEEVERRLRGAGYFLSRDGEWLEFKPDIHHYSMKKAGRI